MPRPPGVRLGRQVPREEEHRGNSHEAARDAWEGNESSPGPGRPTQPQQPAISKPSRGSSQYRIAEPGAPARGGPAQTVSPPGTSRPGASARPVPAKDTARQQPAQDTARPEPSDQARADVRPLAGPPGQPNG